MTTAQALQRLTDVIRRKHLALATEHSYRMWLTRYCDYIKPLPSSLSSEQKLERFLTALAQDNVAASTQNQAFNAVLFFYKEALGTELQNVQSLRARRPERMRHAPSRENTLRLLKEVQKSSSFAVGLATRLLYGCGLRVTEPLNFRIKDIDLESGKFFIRSAKGGKDRVAAIPCAVLTDLKEQMDSARVIWKADQRAQLPVSLPHQLAAKYPRAAFDWNWAWLFPANQPCHDPRSGKLVRWRLHEANLQRGIRKASLDTGVFILPHELRHAYATHCLNRGSNPKAIQEVMGHKSIETTMGYLHADALAVNSPLD